MKQVLKYTGYILILLIIGFLIWRFSYIIVWVLIAAMVSFIGQPLVTFFDRIHIRKLRMPRPLSALLALLIIVLIAARIRCNHCSAHNQSGRDGIIDRFRQADRES